MGLKKMSEVMKQPNPYTTDKHVPGPKSVNKDGRKHELQRITKENQRILKAIQDVEPVYNHRKWEQSFAKSAVLLQNCSTYPVITRMSRKQSAPSVLMRLGQDMAGDGTPSPASQAASPTSRHDDVQYVLKEGKRIGETYFLVEMSTDGRTLNISAYDGDSRTSLELVVKEKNHRQLYREAGGDYSLIASRLRVDGNRLVLQGSD